MLEHILVISSVLLLASLFLWPQIHYARQTPLYQAAFMGIGAYTAAFLVSRWGWSWPVAISLAAMIAAFSGALASAITHRTRDDTFAIASLGLQLVASNSFILAEPITGGAAGIFFLPQLFSSPIWQWLTLALTAGLALLYLWWLPHGALGRHCRALGDDPMLYETWGWPARALKSLLGGLAAMGAGVSGAIFVGYLSVAEPSIFTVSYSITLVGMTLLIPGRPLIVLPASCLVFAATPELLRLIGLDAARAAHGREALFYGLLIVASFRGRKEPRPLPGALSGGAWAE